MWFIIYTRGNATPNQRRWKEYGKAKELASDISDIQQSTPLRREGEFSLFFPLKIHLFCFANGLIHIFFIWYIFVLDSYNTSNAIFRI